MQNIDPEYAKMTDEERAALPHFPWDESAFPDCKGKWVLVNLAQRNPAPMHKDNDMNAWVIEIGGYRAQVYPDGWGVSVAKPDDCYESWRYKEPYTAEERKQLCIDTIRSWADNALQRANAELAAVEDDLERLESNNELE